MEAPNQRPPGLVNLLGRFGSTLFSTVQTRLELFTVELAEERERFLQVLFWSAAALFFAMLTVIMVSMAVVFACPAKARPYVLAAFCLLYLALAVGAAWGLRKRLRQQQGPFSASLAELKKDAASFRSQS